MVLNFSQTEPKMGTNCDTIFIDQKELSWMKLWRIFQNGRTDDAKVMTKTAEQARFKKRHFTFLATK